MCLQAHLSMKILYDIKENLLKIFLKGGNLCGYFTHFQEVWLASFSVYIFCKKIILPIRNGQDTTGECGPLCYWLAQTILKQQWSHEKEGFFFLYSIERHRDLNEQKMKQHWLKQAFNPKFIFMSASQPPRTGVAALQSHMGLRTCLFFLLSHT